MQRAEMKRHQSKAEADHSPQAVGKDRAGRAATDARMQNQHQARRDDGKHRQNSGDRRTDIVRQANDHGDQRRYQQRAQRNVVPAPADRRHHHLPIALRQRQADRADQRIDREPTGQRPRHGMRHRRQHQPRHDRRPKAGESAMPLRHQGIDHAECDDDGIDRQRRQRTGGNKCVVVIKREKDINRAGIDRQRRHQ